MDPVTFLLLGASDDLMGKVEMALENAGLRVVKINHPQHAASLLAQPNRPEALLVTHSLPLESGLFQTLAEANQAVCDLPMLLLGGSTKAWREARAAGFNAVDCFPLPFDPELFCIRAQFMAELASQKRSYRAIERRCVEAETKAQESRADTRRVLDNLFAFVGVLDLDGTVLEANRAPLDAAGITEADVIGKKFWDTYWWSYSADVQSKLRESFERAKAGEIVRYDVMVRMAGESRMWIDFQLAPLRDGQGRIARLIPSAMDVTRRRMAQEDLHHQKSQLRTILEHLPVGVFYTDADGTILFGNPAGQRIWGGVRFVGPEKYGEYKGWWHETKRPLKAEDWALVRALRNREASIGELIDIECFDGTRKTISNSAVPIISETGEVLGALVINEDVSERLAALREVRVSETRFRQLADSMPQLVWTADQSGQVDYYNRNLQNYSGAQQVSDGTWQWQAILHPEDLARTEAAWKQALDEGSTYQAEHRVQMANGTFRWHLSRAFPSRDADGRIVKWFGTATDIDDQKRAQEILERTVEERTSKLRETVSELEAFSYSIAHDLRAPLRSLHGFSQLLLTDYQDKLDQTGVDFLRRISAAAHRMDLLVMDVLNYSRVVRGDATIEPVDIEQLLREIIDTYPSMRERNAIIEIEPTFPFVLGNQAMLTQVFSNLLGNAVKFVSAGVQPHVRVWAEQVSDEEVRIYVRDNGIGIAPEHHQRVFGIFQRAHQAYEGTGIGLAIVQKAAQRMGGSVGVQSMPGQGSTFWISLRSAKDLKPALQLNL